MAEELENNIPSSQPQHTPEFPKVPDLSDITNKGDWRNWDRANQDQASNAEKEWGHAGIPPEQPIDKSGKDD